MSDLKASSRRILAAYRGRKADRVPMMSPISWSPMRDIDAEKPLSWRADPGFIEVAHLVQEHCDPAPPHGPWPRVFSSAVSYQRFLEAGDEFIEHLPIEQLSDIRTRHTSILHTPKGDLTYALERDKDIETWWDAIKPIQSPEDVEKMLSVPYHFVPPPASDFEIFRKHRAEHGADCLGGGPVNSMVAMLCAMMPFQLLLEWVLAEPTLVKLLADEWLRRTDEKVKFMQAQGVGPFWHFNGVERASPPMMGPRQWETLVTPYDGEIMRRIKQRDPEALIHVHCHGRVGTLLDSFLAMGADSTDPVEPPPQGDIDFAAAKAKVAGKMTLYGNIEFVDMERGTPEQVEQKVRSAIEDGGKEHTILFPSATPHERATEKFLANAKAYIRAGLKYGKL